MIDKELEKELLKYEIPQPDKKKIDALIFLANNQNTCERKGEKFSLLRQLSMQITYLDKLFYIICLVFLIYISVLIINNIELAGAFLRIPPLLIIPCALMLLRSRHNKMYELELSSRYGYTRLFVGKMLIVGLVSVATITLSWVCSILILSEMNILPLLLAACSYSISCLLLLWFGKKNIIHGLVICILWCGFTQFFSRYSPTKVIIDSIQIGSLIIIFTIIICLIAITCNYYLKNHRFQEESLWNLA